MPMSQIPSTVQTKTNSNFVVNFAEMLKEEIIHFCLFDKSHFSNICTLYYVPIKYIEINGLYNIGKRSEASRLLFQ